MRRTFRTGMTAIAVAGLIAAVGGSSVLGADPSAAPEPTPRTPGAWFEALEPGMCFDDAFTDDGWDFATGPLIVSCEGPHDNELVARVPLDFDSFPEEDLEPTMVELCAPEYEAFLGRPEEQSLLNTSAYWPIESDWEAGVTYGFCTVYAAGPVSGTGRSGSLTAPGERIAVYREVDGVPDIWVVDAGTRELTNVTQGQVKVVIDIPAWRPDGSAIAFTMEESPEDTGIHEVPAAGGETVPVLVGPGRQDGAAFSADGERMAYISDVDATEYEIYTLDIATGDGNRLTDHADRDTSPEWSPDGEHIAFRRRTDGENDIWVMRADGSNPVQLTADSGHNFGPRWSPDGSSILFSSNRAGNYDVWVMDADGGNQRPLTTHPGLDDFPAWSSDGSFIAFQSDRYGGVTLWLMRADGSDQSELAGTGALGWARFSPVADD